ncbi:MAG: hypothetical protein PF961_22275 [Planctomycetota bacterium]|jgi:hypothetical protein|nr:hypothetical protein [Planctomycetota bacterium]
MARYPKSLERVARDLHRSKCEIEYITHYMMEEYRIPPEMVQEILVAIGIGETAAEADMSVTDKRREKHRKRFQNFNM